jgi:transcriptional regulator with XRE-family HTH domain
MQVFLAATELDSARMGRPAYKPKGKFGCYLAELREAAGLTQQQLADKLNVHQSNIAFWERWDKPPRGEVLPQLARTLGVSIDQLLGNVPPKSKTTVAKGRLQRVFERASRLSRRQQTKIADVIDALVDRESKNTDAHAKAA